MALERNAKGKRPLFYDTPGMDEAMSMIMVLANELSVMRDRLDTVERVAAAKGLVLEAEIEAFEPDQVVLETRELRRRLMRLRWASDAARKSRSCGWDGECPDG
jgi:hypothetical protein